MIDTLGIVQCPVADLEIVFNLTLVTEIGFLTIKKNDLTPPMMEKILWPLTKINWYQEFVQACLIDKKILLLSPNCNSDGYIFGKRFKSNSQRDFDKYLNLHIYLFSIFDTEQRISLLKIKNTFRHGFLPTVKLSY